MRVLVVLLCVAAVCQDGRETKDPEVRLQEILQMAQTELAKINGYTAKIEATGSNCSTDFFNVEETGEVKVNLKEHKCLMSLQTMKIEQDGAKTPVGNLTVYYDGTYFTILDNMTKQCIKYTYSKPSRLRKFAPAIVCADLVWGLVSQVFNVACCTDAAAQRDFNEKPNLHLTKEELERQKNPDGNVIVVIEQLPDGNGGFKTIERKISGDDLRKMLDAVQQEKVDPEKLKGGEIVYYWGFRLDPKSVPPSEIKVQNLMLDLAEKTFLPLRLWFDWFTDDGKIAGNRCINFKDVKPGDVAASEPDLTGFTITVVEAK